jgi:GNAT superfamily N-acetyltransferase
MRSAPALREPTSVRCNGFRRFVIPYSLERHQAECARDEVAYLSVYDREEFVGYVILVLDPDGRSVEFRRIAVVKPGMRHGTSAMAMVHAYCRDRLNRARVWLDVFADNDRAIRLYAASGYQPYGHPAIKVASWYCTRESSESHGVRCSAGGPRVERSGSADLLTERLSHGSSA